MRDDNEDDNVIEFAAEEIAVTMDEVDSRSAASRLHCISRESLLVAAAVLAVPFSLSPPPPPPPPDRSNVSNSATAKVEATSRH